MSAVQTPPERDIDLLPEPAPLQRSTTDESPLSSDTLTRTGLLVQVELSRGWPADIGSCSSTSETLTPALPVAQETPIVPDDEPSPRPPRFARTVTRVDAPAATRPVDGEADSQPAFDVRR